MKYTLRLLLIILLPAFFLQQTQAQKNKTDKRFAGLDTAVARVLKEWHAAGCAVAVVQKNKIIYAAGFGYKDYEQKLLVTPNTVFAIGSCTKAFTASVLGILANEGKIDLDKPVYNYLPELKFYNDYLTTHVTIKDMMTHRTGLPRHDFAWYSDSKISRDSLITRIRYFEPSAELRERWQYNNFMFVAQGVLGEKITGKKWEQNVQEKILDSLDMHATSFAITDLQKNPDHAIGYYERKDSIKKSDYKDINSIGPAGAINSNVNDMANWVITWINGGKFNGKQVLPASYVTQATTAQMTLSAPPDPKSPDVFLSDYGFAWFITSYRGHYRVEHGGNIDGFTASTCFFPNDSIGIVILVNQNGSAVNGIVRNLIADKLLSLPYKDWNTSIMQIIKKAKEADTLKNKTEDLSRKLNTKPSHALEDYTGKFTNAGYGTIEIKKQHDSLFGTLNEIPITLKHYHYDFFNAYVPEKIDPDGDPIKFQFQTNVKGDIESVSVPLEASVKDIVFTKEVEAIEIKKDDLQKYTGEYLLSGLTIKVYLKNENTLMILVPGQPDYEMVPVKKDEFNFKALKGYSAKFTVNEKNITTKLFFIQPNGTFKAVKK